MGLQYKVVDSEPFSSFLTVVSKKFMDLEEVSIVNFIVL